MKMKQNSRRTTALGHKQSAKRRPVAIITDHAVINGCLALMEKRFREPIQLRDLVEFSNMSSRGFHKAFVRKVGINPGKFLRNMRIKYAKQLLIEDDLTLKEIALRCGFRSDNTLCVAFLREVNTSPKRFRRQYWLEANRRAGRTIALPRESVRLPATLPALATNSSPAKWNRAEF